MGRIPVEQRRKALIAAALRVVASRGLAGASTRAIVTEAGMSLASFHYAFESRDELIEQLIPEVIASEELAILPETVAGSMVDLLTEGLMGYLDHLRADPAHEQAMLELTQYALRERPELARRQYEQYARIARVGLELAARHTGQRWSEPIDTVAALLLSLTDGLTLGWLVTRDDETAERVVATAARVVASLARPARRGEGAST